jgi:hypothetical protein
MAQSKERQIATQSSMKLVLDWANSCGKCFDLKDIIWATNILVDYVENGYAESFSARCDKFQDYIDHKGLPKKQ